MTSSYRGKLKVARCGTCQNRQREDNGESYQCFGYSHCTQIFPKKFTTASRVKRLSDGKHVSNPKNDSGSGHVQRPSPECKK